MAKVESIKTPVPQAPNRPLTPAMQVPAPAHPAIAKDAYKPNAVPGENIRTGMSLGMGVLGPVPTAQQAITKLAPAVAHLPVIGPLARWAERGLSAMQAIPAVAVTLRGVSRVVPIMGAGVLAFDVYATYKTFTDTAPPASNKRKWLVAARLACNTVGTALAFVPGWGMLASLPASLASVGFDLWIKVLNAHEQAPARAAA